MSEKKLYNIVHIWNGDGGFGDATYQEDVIGTTWATEEEAKEFEAKWDKPVVYDCPYAELTCHGIELREAEFVDISTFVPYDEDRDPYGLEIKDRFKNNEEA